jgi:hypothetical protein
MLQALDPAQDLAQDVRSLKDLGERQDMRSVAI